MSASNLNPIVTCVLTGGILVLSAAPALAQDAKPVGVDGRVDGRAGLTGSDAALREAAAVAVAEGCITITGQIRDNPGGLDACTITSGGDTSSAMLGDGGCAIVIDSYLSNWACNGNGTDLASRIKTASIRYGPDDELPDGISGAGEPSCSVDDDCLALGYHGACQDTNGDFIPDTCGRAWIQSDIVPNANLDLPSCNTISYHCGSTVTSTPPVLDPGGLVYVMSIRVLVDPDTVGTVVIPFQGPNINTFVIMGDNSVPGFGKVVEATIEVLEDDYCCDVGVCSFGGPPGTCASMGLALASGPCRGDCDGNSIDDACQTYTDCNGNGVIDKCDVFSGFSDDCNNNLTPDECESQDDCDSNGTVDICQNLDHETEDCNWNGVPDACDISMGNEPDDDGNGVIDYCEMRSRFIYFDAPSGELAIRIKFLSLDLFGGLNGEVRWLQAPASRLPDNQSTSFWASEAGCDPVLTTWPDGERLYVFGSSIVPNSDYEIRFADADCVASGLETCMSAPIQRSTWVWADVRSPYLNHGSPVQPSAFDVTAMVDTFKGFGLDIEYTRARIYGDTPSVSSAISFADISACVDAHKGFSYPFDGPDACP